MRISTFLALIAMLSSAGLPPFIHGQDPRPAPSDTDTGWTWERVAGQAIPCEEGKIKIFDCQAVELLSFLPRDDFIVPPNRRDSVPGAGSISSDIWGWTDPKTGREFAILCRNHVTVFVEVTDPLNPQYLGELPARAGGPQDLKVYNDHVFIVGQAGRFRGMQIFDLRQLLTVEETPASFQETAYYENLGAAHNIVINEATGFAYVVGGIGDKGEHCGSGGLYMIDIRNPIQPTFAGCHANMEVGFPGSRNPSGFGRSATWGYVHDAQCVIYHGPDQRYRDRELCFNSATVAVVIVDVTDKKQTKTIGIATYPNVGYTHQGWLTDDHRYFFLGDELDEGGERPTRTIVFDLEKLDDPIVAKEYSGPTTDIDHNLYIRGQYMYQSNYTAGLRVIDVRDPKNPQEVGYLDTAPAETKGTSNWSNYPYFKSGAIALGTGKGLFMVRFKP